MSPSMKVARILFTKPILIERADTFDFSLFKQEHKQISVPIEFINFKCKSKKVNKNIFGKII